MLGLVALAQRPALQATPALISLGEVLFASVDDVYIRAPAGRARANLVLECRSTWGRLACKNAAANSYLQSVWLILLLLMW